MAGDITKAELARAKIWGHPQHGVCKAGQVTLPNAALFSRAQPGGNTAQVIAIPGYPSPVIAPIDATLYAERGLEWRNYALLSGDDHTVYAKALGVDSWLYVDEANTVWLAKIQSAVFNSGHTTFTVTIRLRRFGIFPDFVGGTDFRDVVAVTSNMLDLTASYAAGLWRCSKRVRTVSRTGRAATIWVDSNDGGYATDTDRPESPLNWGVFIIRMSGVGDKTPGNLAAGITATAQLHAGLSRTAFYDGSVVINDTSVIHDKFGSFSYGGGATGGGVVVVEGFRRSGGRVDAAIEAHYTTTQTGDYLVGVVFTEDANEDVIELRQTIERKFVGEGTASFSDSAGTVTASADNMLTATDKVACWVGATLIEQLPTSTYTGQHVQSYLETPGPVIVTDTSDRTQNVSIESGLFSASHSVSGASPNAAYSGIALFSAQGGGLGLDWILSGVKYAYRAQWFSTCRNTVSLYRYGGTVLSEQTIGQEYQAVLSGSASTRHGKIGALGAAQNDVQEIIGGVTITVRNYNAIVVTGPRHHSFQPWLKTWVRGESQPICWV